VFLGVKKKKVAMTPSHFRISCGKLPGKMCLGTPWDFPNISHGNDGPNWRWIFGTTCGSISWQINWDVNINL